MRTFKIQGVGIDCTTLDYPPLEDMDFDYLFTSIEANNEEIIREFVRDINSGSPLITRLSFLDRCLDAVANHVNELGRDTIDLLLVDAGCDFVKYADKLSYLVESRYVDVLGVYNPESVDRLKEIMSVVSNLKYVGLEICPLNFNYDLVKFIQEQGLEIVAFNPFGGKLSSWGLINSFSVPYLLEFMAFYSVLGILSGHDVYLSWKEKDYLNSLIGKPVRDENLYLLDKNISKLYESYNKMVGMSLKVDLNHTMPVQLPDSIFSPDDIELNLGEAIEDTRDFDIAVGGVEDKVYDRYRDFALPGDTESDLAIISLFKPVAKDIIREKLGSEWAVSEQRVDKKMFIIYAICPIYKGKWIFRRLREMKIKNYLFCINNKSLEFTLLDEITQSATNET